MSVSLTELIQKASSLHGSDVHLKTNRPPFFRNRNGVLSQLDSDTIPPSLMERYVLDCFQLSGRIQSWDNAQNFLADMRKAEADADLAITVDGQRIRCNLFYDLNGLSIACRLLSNHIPTIEQIQLPYPLREVIKKREGLVLFCGATGSGKTTALFALLNAINQQEPKHIITLEDPVEYQLKPGKSIISQREVGRDCDDFPNGLRSALRQDPDVILVGEMRDADTIATALRAAETGHLVFSSIHAATFAEAIDRIVQYFPADEHTQRISEFANAMRAMVCCELLTRKDGQGRVGAYALLLPTPATLSCIRDDNMKMVETFMSTGQGMQTMKQAKEALAFHGMI